jgi:hypothetical protein
VVGGRVPRGAAGHSAGSAAAALSPLGRRASGVSRLARAFLGHDIVLSAAGAEDLHGSGALVTEVSRLLTSSAQRGEGLLSWGRCSGGILWGGGSFRWGWSSCWPACRHFCGGGLLVCPSGGPCLFPEQGFQFLD